MATVSVDLWMNLSLHDFKGEQMKSCGVVYGLWLETKMQQWWRVQRHNKGGEGEGATEKERGRTKEEKEKDKRKLSTILQTDKLVHQNFDNNLICVNNTPQILGWKIGPMISHRITRLG